MNYDNAGFRFLYQRFIVFDKMIVSDQKKDYQKYEEADGALTYGYIDHQRGFSFLLLGLIRKTADGIQVIETKPVSITTIIRAESIPQEEAMIINDDEKLSESFKKEIEDIKANYDNDKGIQESRELSYLDELRDPYYVDDVQVYLFGNELGPEICWVRIEGCGEDHLRGVLLNEPEEDLGFHINDEVYFTLKKTYDDTWMAIAEQNRQ